MASILIVDDDRNILFLLSEVLTRQNHQVTKANDGAKAIPLLQQQDFDLVISDLHMKQVNGIEVLKAVKKKDPNLDILILTGYGTVNSAVQAMKLGAFDYLTKPLNIEELRMKVDQALEHQSNRLKIASQERKLKMHQEMIERDLKLAKTIQQTLIPQPFENNQITVNILHRPIIGVGGDFADIHYENNDHIYLNLIDVTGHGIAAALIVNRICNEIRKMVRDRLQPGEILFQLNNFIIDSFYLTGMFLTAFSCLIDLKKRQMIYAGSAHPPLLITQNNKVRQLSSQNTIIGFQKSTENAFIQNSLPIETHDRLLMYTDGIVEIENEVGKQFGVKGLQAAFEKTNSTPISDVLDQLMNSMNSFRRYPVRDDIYLLVVC